MLRDQYSKWDDMTLDHLLILTTHHCLFYAKDLRLCPLIISGILSLWTSCLQRSKEYHSSPHTNVFTFTEIITS